MPRWNEMRELQGRRCAADGVESQANTTATDKTETASLRRPSQLGRRPVTHLRLLSSPMTSRPFTCPMPRGWPARASEHKEIRS
ncbi:hypothetical protein ASPTUDRAFT_39249 [Aspergillus tubingensis CBS 134.48]|uniref:Uncharacterized protein n=1 Tax=Aspergillus tubingensis (strain CBS 134.48) TaxID=767770 RepID=A0A1L9NAX1_ASPTC|nr:hypothetical protein ASPTUDRAFT_39249 [Aspergillus tubingensis CBS 134.48]